MEKEVSVDVFRDKKALDIVIEELNAAKDSVEDIDLKIIITGYFPGKRC